MSIIVGLKRLVVGKPIRTEDAHQERLPKVFGLPVFASDALSSAAYATEETMRILMLAGAAYFSFTLPIAGAVSLLLLIVAISYYQTIHAYPSGGGAFTVGSKNLGSFAGQVAGGALLIDYVLTVSVSISAGVLALVSMFPQLHPYVIDLGIAFTALIAIVNLRGTKESGIVFAIPSYSFVILMLGMIVYGLFRMSLPVAASSPLPPAHAAEAFGILLLLRAFSSGCVALTGTEAISNGVQAFRPPEARNATITLMIMALLLGTMFLGSAWLAQHLHITPMSLDDPNFKTVIAMICEKLTGTGLYFYALQIATALILILAANTAFADFPRLASLMARDGYLPRQLSSLGDRLVFQNGIIVLAAVAILLIIFFKGDTHALIPLYAVGVFTSFTISQAGMVVHQIRERRRAVWLISLVGAIATGVVTLVLLITKFEEGAWMVTVALAVMLFIFSRIKRHYTYLASELSLTPIEAEPPLKTSVILLTPRVHRGILHAIAYARNLSTDIRALHVVIDPRTVEPAKEAWTRYVRDIPLIILESPYRSLVEPITSYVDEMLSAHKDQTVTVIVPQAVPRYWWQGILHNNAAASLKRQLANRERVVITNVRYFLH
jgi:amino acid transporter